ncbi:hypothetical protein [Flavobacterium sp. UMI-01]|uniref:hypothetical protein n=1 Tax=Flavobacterium sp. UMI-01 TaxID=1441053 RepID=UPI001C7D3468|nr:hypothetical protein [Flavobacterium sp. UMI-01]GIZ09886.1 hypothetical protein FUMI01_26120 [Flavobacterium sp. UMI-01]
MKPIDNKENLEDKNNPSQQMDEKFIKNANKVDYFPASRSDKQTQSEIAEQGYTVRDGHNPNTPNPYEEQITNDEFDLNDDFHTDRDLEEPLDSNGNIKNENDEFDNPSDSFVDDYFQETEEESDAIESIDDEDTAKYNPDDYKE